MTNLNTNAAYTATGDTSTALDPADVAPRPRTAAETGLSDTLITELLLKHLYTAGVLTLQELVSQMALAGTILEPVIGFLRQEARVETRAGHGSHGEPRFALTDKGRSMALDALLRSGYVGPAPVPISEYRRVVLEQSLHTAEVTQESMARAFDGTVIPDHLLDQLGAAVTSGRAVFVYGPAGTGKTFITKRLSRLLGDSVLVPHAISVNDVVMQLYDPVMHHPVEAQVNSTDSSSHSVFMALGHDPRFLVCHRPIAVSGGELTLDMLEIHHDEATQTYRAPVQLKANNGLLIIDDLGRQRVAPVDLLNRWIVPLEERRDYLSIGSGTHFDVPFNVVLIFSTNLNPLDLADEAFLRRIGYKIRFDYLTPTEYSAIWQQTCEELEIEYDPSLVQFMINEMHRERSIPLRPCHPRDLINIALDRTRYLRSESSIEIDDLRWAWDNYFVSLKDGDKSQLSS